MILGRRCGGGRRGSNLGRCKDDRYAVGASYSTDLATDFGRKVRKAVARQLWKERAETFQLDPWSARNEAYAPEKILRPVAIANFRSDSSSATNHALMANKRKPERKASTKLG